MEEGISNPQANNVGGETAGGVSNPQSTTPPAFTPSLDFSDGRNSQYFGLLGGI